MTEDPRFNLLPGTEITLLRRPMVVTGMTDDGYKVAGIEDGIITVLPFGTLARQLKLPGARIDTTLPSTGGRLRQRLGGYSTAQALSKEQRELGNFHLALCQGVAAYRAKLRVDRGDPDLQISQRMADTREARKFIAIVAEQFLGEKIHLNPPRGGKTGGYFVYQGRTLMKYFNTYENLQPGDDPVDALVSLDHLKGNRTIRICNQVRKLMTEAWEQVGLDVKCPSISNVLKVLEADILQKNAERHRNELPELKVPSSKTVREHREALLTPSEYLLGTKGIRHARNKRGRGSTDLRALIIGELGEMDECKMSLVMSAKTAGVWEKMSDQAKADLETLEEYIKARFWILVMIDVATRMPLAWVIAETPNAEATLALLRMATRDKTREKCLYGCTGEPAAAMGLMHVKNDNGSGLRNATVVQALVGTGSINTITRAYSSTDRHHIERMFGTLEMDVFKLLPGYTGRAPGELPGYDAMKDGVITVEQLHEIVTRYFIDEYPYTRHYGVGMGGRRPIEVYKSINATRGQVHPLDPNTRRIQLGWEQDVTPTDEGVRVFHGIWFNSDELQQKREEYSVSGKVKVYVDPDDMNLATVVLPKVEDPIEVQLQMTAYADMTLPEILHLMVEQRLEHPQATEFYDDQLMRTRQHRQAQIKAIGVENHLPRSYSTFEECKNKAKAVFAGSRVLRSEPIPGTTRAGEITSMQPSEGIYRIGEPGLLIDGTAEEIRPLETQDPAASGDLKAAEPPATEPQIPRKQPTPPPPTPPLPQTSNLLSRPDKLKGFK